MCQGGLWPGRSHHLQHNGKLFPIKGRKFRPVFGKTFPTSERHPVTPAWRRRAVAGDGRIGRTLASGAAQQDEGMESASHTKKRPNATHRATR